VAEVLAFAHHASGSPNIKFRFALENATKLDRCENRSKTATISSAQADALEVEARAHAALIKGLMRRTAEGVITIGQALIRQQRALNRSFQSWIAAEFDMSQSAAYRFINVAERFDSKHPTVGRLPLAALYGLAAPSTPPEVQAEVERRIAAGWEGAGEALTPCPPLGWHRLEITHGAGHRSGARAI
jgi:hypothetical protein